MEPTIAIREAYENCPRFKKCSVNKCPLDSYYPERGSVPDDKERRCSLGKTLRLRCAEGFHLRYGGLTEREFKAKQKYNSLAEDQKAALKERGKRLANLKKA